MEVKQIKSMFERSNIISEPEIIDAYVSLAVMLNNKLPEGREKSLVMTKLQESYLFSAASQ